MPNHLHDLRISHFYDHHKLNIAMLAYNTEIRTLQ
jgi:hypothetical protein